MSREPPVADYLPHYLVTEHYRPAAVRKAIAQSFAITLREVHAATASGALDILSEDGKEAWRTIFGRLDEAGANQEERYRVEKVLFDASAPQKDREELAHRLGETPLGCVLVGPLMLYAFIAPEAATRFAEACESRYRSRIVKKHVERALRPTDSAVGW